MPFSLTDGMWYGKLSINFKQKSINIGPLAIREIL